jgi:hypothetical protein
MPLVSKQLEHIHFTGFGRGIFFGETMVSTINLKVFPANFFQLQPRLGILKIAIQSDLWPVRKKAIHSKMHIKYATELDDP